MKPSVVKLSLCSYSGGGGGASGGSGGQGGSCGGDNGYRIVTIKALKLKT